jgi:hypothetical protein
MDLNTLNLLNKQEYLESIIRKNQVTKKFRSQISAYNLLIKEHQKGIEEAREVISSIEEKVNENRIVVARNNGYIIDDYNNLACYLHPEASFNQVVSASPDEKFSVYACSDCLSEEYINQIELLSVLTKRYYPHPEGPSSEESKLMAKKDKIRSIGISFAYGCKTCEGIIPGLPIHPLKQMSNLNSSKCFICRK